MRLQRYKIHQIKITPILSNNSTAKVGISWESQAYIFPFLSDKHPSYGKNE
jgi:hypothetical protein